MERIVTGRALADGRAEGAVLAASEPLSFWGGWDAATGEIIDRRHPLSGRAGTGTVLVIPHTRGSSTSTAILLESVRRGTAPAALVCSQEDPFVVLASVVAAELYGVELPVVLVSESDMDALAGASWARIEPGGRIELEGGAHPEGPGSRRRR